MSAYGRIVTALPSYPGRRRCGHRTARRRRHLPLTTVYQYTIGAAASGSPIGLGAEADIEKGIGSLAVPCAECVRQRRYGDILLAFADAEETLSTSHAEASANLQAMRRGVRGYLPARVVTKREGL